MTRHTQRLYDIVIALFSLAADDEITNAAAKSKDLLALTPALAVIK